MRDQLAQRNTTRMDGHTADDLVAGIIAEHYPGLSRRGGSGRSIIRDDISYGAVLRNLALDGDQAVLIDREDIIGGSIRDAAVIHWNELINAGIHRLCVELIGIALLIELDLLGHILNGRVSQLDVDLGVLGDGDFLVWPDGSVIGGHREDRLAVGHMRRDLQRGVLMHQIA